MSIKDVVEVVDGVVARVWRNASKTAIGLSMPGIANRLHETAPGQVHSAYILVNGDFWPPARVVQPERISAACERRILAVLSRNTQANLSAYATDLSLKVGAGEQLTADEQADIAAARAARAWTVAMIQACRSMIAALDPGYLDDASWPAPSQQVIQIAARF